MASLYTYLPKDNDADTVGIRSTAFSKDGWKKYIERSGKKTREEVLEWLDQLDPTFKRSYAVSVLSEPIPEDAFEDFVAFAKAKARYKLKSLKELRDTGVITQIRAINTRGRGTHTVKEPMRGKIAWDKKRPGRFLFSHVPHYLIETTNGFIPPEYIEHV